MLRLWFASALLNGQWATGVRIVVADGRIASIETGVEPEPGDERCGVALPGLPNVHSHTFQRAMAGLAERRGAGGDNFWTWRMAMYRFLAELTPDDVEAVAAWAFAEMLESGFTRVGEFHYLHHDPDGRPYVDPGELAVRIVAAAGTSGIGLTILPVFYAHSDFGGLPPTQEQRRFVTDLGEFAKLVEATRRAASGHPGAVVGVAPHSLRAVTAEELREVVSLAGNGPVHIHVAEQLREVDSCLAWSGRRPVEWLLEHQPVDGRWCLVHATHTTEAERVGVASRGAVVGLCPVTEANLGDGVFDTLAFQKAGGRFGIGTDSNILIDAAGELRQLEYAQRLVTRTRNVLATDDRSTGRALFDTVYQAGSQALGVASKGLSVGQPADIVSLATDHPAFVARHGDALIDGWVFAAKAGAIDRVWVNGRLVVVDGRHVAREILERRFRSCLKRILT